MDNDSYPALFRAADTHSLLHHRRFVAAQISQLLLLVLAAVGGATSIVVADARISAILSAAALGLALLVRLYLSQTKPEREWYNGRAVAESVKSLTWKYQTRAVPFDIADDAASELLIERMQEILDEMPNVSQPSNQGEAISASMNDLRSGSLGSRQSYYLTHRVDDQAAWYTTKSTYNGNRANQWNIALLVLEGFGLLAAILRAATVIDFDWAGIAGTLAPSIHTDLLRAGLAA